MLYYFSLFDSEPSGVTDTNIKEKSGGEKKQYQPASPVMHY